MAKVETGSRIFRRGERLAKHVKESFTTSALRKHGSPRYFEDIADPYPEGNQDAYTVCI